MASSKSKKPTSLKIERNKGKFVTGWKINGGDYKDGQQWQYKINSGSWKHHPSASDSDISKTATSKTLSVDFDDYYPKGSTKLKKFSFRVRGNKAKSGSTNLGWSDWSDKPYELLPPSKPSASLEKDDNITKWSWTVSTSDTNKKPFYKVNLWTALEKGNADPEKVSSWTKITSSTSSHEGATVTKSTYNTSKEGFNATGWVKFVENSSKISDSTNGNWVRFIRLRSYGCAGYDDFVYKKRVYGPAQMADQDEGEVNEAPGGYSVTVNWDTAYDSASPIDKTEVQWVIATPNSDLSCPSGASWNVGATSHDTKGGESAVLNIDQTVGRDECLWTRIVTYHDNTPTNGVPKLQITGKLSDPTITVGVTSQESRTAQITVSHRFVVSGTKIAIIYDNDGSQSIVGLVSSASTVTVKCPAWSDDDTVTFGAKAVLPRSSTPHTDSSGVTTYDIDSYMESDLIMQSGAAAVAPTGVSLSRAGDDIRVSWQNNWTSASGIELSWADNPYAWESTDQPSTFEISNPYLTSWRIAGLETGKTWYVKVRAYMNGEVKSYSQFSPVASINLSSAPSTPTIALSRFNVATGESVTASWEYESTDGTPQQEARIYSYYVPSAENYDSTATYDVGDYAYHSSTLYVCNTTISVAEEWTPAHWDEVTASDLYTLIATTATQEYIDLKFDNAGMYQLCVEVVSKSGQLSDISQSVNLTVAQPLTCSMTSSLTDVTVIDDDDEERTVHALTALPLTATVTGVGNGGITSLTIVRSEAYDLERPDESEIDGFEGETIVSYIQDDDKPISIGYDDLIGSLDDGGKYILTATVSDDLGQSAQVEDEFTVMWARHAITPSGEVLIDNDTYSAILVPIAPTGTISSDVCDIYRLSSDKPVLVYKGATFGSKYVDPYPAIGENGGYRFVMRTAEGDYTTAENTLAFYDCYDDMLDLNKTIINFGGEALVLQYNLDVSHQWEKSFVAEKFLDGSVKGYWNAGVSRSGNVSSVFIPMLEGDIITSLRRLSEYEGRCHVRTPDGSSFPADIQVSESWSHDNAGKMADFQFKITRTDGEPEGIDYADWISV